MAPPNGRVNPAVKELQDNINRLMNQLMGVNNNNYNRAPSETSITSPSFMGGKNLKFQRDFNLDAGGLNGI